MWSVYLFALACLFLYALFLGLDALRRFLFGLPPWKVVKLYNDSIRERKLMTKEEREERQQ